MARGDALGLPAQLPTGERIHRRYGGFAWFAALPDGAVATLRAANPNLDPAPLPEGLLRLPDDGGSRR